jgi:hypothetical protein
VREPAALTALPAAEQAAWGGLWGDVAEVLKRSEAAK